MSSTRYAGGSRAAICRHEPGEDRDRLREQDVESEAVGQLDAIGKHRLEGRDLRVVDTALCEDRRPAGPLPLQMPVGVTSQRLTAEGLADRAVDEMVSRRHVEQGSVEIIDERRRPLTRQSAPPTRLEKREPERIRSPRGTA